MDTKVYSCWIKGICIQRLMGSKLLLIIQARYRRVPTFGSDTIRKFPLNTSAMKKLAARDFEDLLQVRYNIFTFYPSSCDAPAVCYTMF